MKPVLLASLLATLSYGSVVDNFLNSLKEEALKENPNFKSFDFKRGEEIFISKHIGKRGELISCVSCHGNDLAKASKNYFTGKDIEALSPKANPKRFSNRSEIEKWLKRNFNDVYNREGTALEKGDVVTYIINKGVK